MATLVLDATIETARINELPLFSSFGPLTTNDYFVMWLAAFDKTVKIDAQSMYDFMQGVGAGTFTPVIIGDKYIYEVPSAAAGGVNASIPELAGQNFFLQFENGYPYKTTEFEILNAGGFKLKKTGEVLVEGTRFTLTLYSLQGGSTTTTNPVIPLIVGAVPVTTNLTYDVVNHVNKLIQLRGGSTQLQFTLPLIEDIPDNTIIIIESMISNTVEHKIQTQGGQLIYLNNVSKTALYMRAGEALWLYRGEDGYYVLNQDFAKRYAEIACKIEASYKVGLNEILANGQLIGKTAYRRVIEQVQTFGGAYVDRATYDGDPNSYKGCWVNWDADYVKVPDLMNQFLRGLLSDSGTDAERTVNKPGGFQDEAVNISTNVKGVKVTGVDTIGPAGLPLDNINGPSGQEFDLDHVFSISPKQGTETRPVNIGVLWTIKV